MASNLLSIGTGIGAIATGGGAILGTGSVASGAFGIANQLAEIYQHSLIPDSAKGNINRWRY